MSYPTRAEGLVNMITAFLSRSLGLLNRGPGVQRLWVLVFSTASYLQLVWSPNSIGGPEGTLLLGAGFLYHILSPKCSIRGLGPTLLGAGFLYRILSPTGLVSKLTDFLSSPSYIIVQRPLLVGVTIALIQLIHGQGYNSDIPRPEAPVIYIGAFPILTVRPGHKSIYNT